jgi:hypothetical protein
MEVSMNRTTENNRSGASSDVGAGKTGASATAGHTAFSGKTSEAAAEIREVAHQAARQARHAASSVASQATEQVKRAADRQVGVSAEMVARVSNAIRTAADNLDQDVPQLAPFVHGAADQLADLSDALADRSAAELFQATSDFARRRPALVFGATALGGFLLFRLLNASSTPAYAETEESEEHWSDAERDDEFEAYEPFTGAGPRESRASPANGAAPGDRFHGA